MSRVTISANSHDPNERKPYTLRLNAAGLARLDELSDLHKVSRQNLIDMMIALFDDKDPRVVDLLAKHRYAKYSTEERKSVSRIAELIQKGGLDEVEKERLRKLLG